jgi:ribonuclease P protein component
MTKLPSLRNAREFRRVVTEGTRGRSNGVVAFSAPAAESGRIGIVVPGRVGGAVVRNKLKRRIRAILSQIETRGGSDMVVRAEPSASDLSFQELEKHVVQATSKARGRS